MLLRRVFILLQDKWPKCLIKKTEACSSSSRNYDITMQFCNTSLRQRDSAA